MDKVQGLVRRYLLSANFTAAWLVIIAVACPSALNAHPSDLSQEEKVHASMLFKFTELMTWPESTFSHENQHILICTDKDKRFNHFLQSMNTTREGAVHLKQVKVSNEVSSPYCHVTYLSRPTFNIIPASDTRVLVSSTENTPHPMTAIRLYQEGQSVKYELNLQKMNDMQVTLSAELLKYARIKQ